MRKTITVFLLLFVSFLLISCAQDPEVVTFDVSFNTLGGSQVETQSVDENATAVIPEDPTKVSSTFRYWYLEDENHPYDFTSPIIEDITLYALFGKTDVTLSTSVTYDFENLTTEFEVADGTLDLFYESNGHVPYVKIRDFFDLLAGFIDPEVEFTFTEDETGLEIFYQYYDEDEDELYDLSCYFDLETNLITTNDPGFYWAYIYSTETNYGRNIEYLYDFEGNEYIEGDEVIYNLNLYNLDIAYYDGSVVAPYYLINQLFAGSSYYNVYFNGDALYGVYGQVSSSDGLTYMKLKRTDANGTSAPSDLLNHSYDMLAFDLDYFYGLKDFKGIDSFYDILKDYRTDLLSSNYETVSQAIADLLLKTIDEPHTSYGFPGYFAETGYEPPTNALANYGERFNDWYMNGLSAVDDVIAAKWNITTTSGWAANSNKRPYYWFIDDTSAVITFDSFSTSDIDETVEWSDEAYQSIFDEESILPTVADGSRYFVYNQSTDSKDVSETLIWGLASDFETTYGQTLTDNGWTYVKEATTKTDYHADGYYLKTINDVDYMATLNYNGTYSTAYIGLTTSIPSSYDNSWSITGDIFALIESDSAVYLEVMIKEIEQEKPGVENIGLDLTFNTGGNVGALYRILGLMTDEPFAVSSFNRDTYSYSTTYITTSYESYSEYDWFLLSSLVTFSAANELVTIFKQNEIGVIIGQTSGGGASSITPILLPDGTFFTMSSNSVNTIRDDEGNYTFNELGIDPDYEIDQADLYDNDVLAEILGE